MCLSCHRFPTHPTQVNGNWLEFDDSSVRSVTWPDVKEQVAEPCCDRICCVDLAGITL